MKEKMKTIAWWIIKRLIIFIDDDRTLMAHSFARDDITDYHILAERFLENEHRYGTCIESYPDHNKEEEEE